jgi:exodeoxyribonuclease VIII
MDRPLHGLIEISNEDYHAGPGISKSHLDVIAGSSPLHYWYKYLNPKRVLDEPTDDMKLGTAIHSAILEPDLFTSNYVVSPAFNKRTKDGKAMFAQFCEENPGKQILLPDDYQTCLAIRDRVHTHPLVSGLMTGGKTEQSFYTTDPGTGELIKCRFDFLHDSGAYALDVKSARDASPTEFGRAVANFRYDIAVPWYFDILDLLYGEVPQHWMWICFEKTEPYAIGVYFAKSEDIARARETAHRDFMKIVSCKQANHWPDWSDEPLPLDMPTWVKR